MKKMLLALLAPLVLASCGTEILEVAVTGKPYEVLVVADKNVWNSAAGDSLRVVMSQEVEWVNQVEPIFDLFTMAPNGLNELSRRHRNLLILKIDPRADSASLKATFDKYANGQVIMDIVAPSDSSAAKYIAANGEVIVSWLERLERTRMSTRGRKYSAANLTKLIKEKFDFTMYIPTGYRVRNDTTNFLWISYEMPLASQGVVIYTFPRVEGKLDLLAERNAAVAKIPGPSDGSFMSTDTTFRPDLKSYLINEREWFEVRGFWNVKNDFMGGPFVNYTTLDTARNRYIAIDMYVLSPTIKYPKRNYVRQLESLMMNVRVK